METQINKIIRFEINDGQELNTHCLFFKQHLFHPIYSIEYNYGGMRQATERLRIAIVTPSAHRIWSCTKQSSSKSFHYVIKDGSALNSHHKILQRTSSKPMSSWGET